MSDDEEATAPSHLWPPKPRPPPSRPQSSTKRPTLSPRSRQGSRQGSRPATAASLYAGFHASDETKISALVTALGELWDSTDSLSGSFIDLGCGDGKVVREVARAFPDRQTIGVDLQAALVKEAKASAKHEKLTGNCEFHCGDLAAVDLSNVSVVFLYFPPMAMPALLSVLTSSNLRNGATVVSADGAWKSKDSVSDRGTRMQPGWEYTNGEMLEFLQPSRRCWGTADLYFYFWRGNRFDTAEGTAALRAQQKVIDDAQMAAAARVRAKTKEERAEREAWQARTWEEMHSAKEAMRMVSRAPMDRGVSSARARRPVSRELHEMPAPEVTQYLANAAAAAMPKMPWSPPPPPQGIQVQAPRARPTTTNAPRRRQPYLVKRRERDRERFAQLPLVYQMSPYAASMPKPGGPIAPKRPKGAARDAWATTRESMLYNDIQQKERELLNTLNQTVYMLPPEMREMAVLVPPPQTRETEPPPNQTRWARPQTCQALPRKTWERFPRAAKELHALGYNL